MKRALLFLMIMTTLSHATKEGFFKDFFNDGGYGLSARNPTAANVKTLLGFSVEPMITSDKAINSATINGTPGDSNGVLLYPDNAPRFSVYYHAGGQFSHLFLACGMTGQERLRTFFRNGGSWVGSCAGAGAASLSQYPGGPTQVGIWPHFYRDDTAHYSVEMLLHKNDHPIVKYFQQFRGYADSLVSMAYSSGGWFPDDFDPPYTGTEYVGKYHTPGYESSGKHGLITYKDTTKGYEGRIVIIGSHPEGGSATSETGMLFSAMCKYAAEGNGAPKIKGVLRHNATRPMNDNTLPGFEKIGDLQYHHFSLHVAEGADSLRVTLNGNSAFNFNMYIKKGAPAFASQADFRAEGDSGSTRSVLLTRTNGLSTGTWYVSVRCMTTVTVTTITEDYDVYSGNTAVLNGADYSITTALRVGAPGSPSVPGNVSAQPYDSSLKIQLRWNSAVDTVSGVAYYRIFRNGSLLDSSEGVSYLDKALCPLTDYSYTVSAVNSAGIEGRASAPAPASSSRVVVVDNGDAGTYKTGNWAETRDSSITNNGYYLVSLQKDSIFAWETPVKPGIPCTLQIWWKASDNRASNIPIKVYDGGTEIFATTVDQKVNGGRWNTLTVATFTQPKAGIVIKSVSSLSTTSKTCADMVRFAFAGTGAVAENGGSDNNPVDLLLSVSPNPFNPSTRIRYGVPGQTAPVLLGIYDIKGRLVRNLTNRSVMQKGIVTLFWDGRDATGVRMASGLYMARLISGSKQIQRTLFLAK